MAAKHVERNRLIVGIILAVLVGVITGLLITQRAKASCDISNVSHAEHPTYLEAVNETRLMDEQFQCPQE